MLLLSGIRSRMHMSCLNLNGYLIIVCFSKDFGLVSPHFGTNVLCSNGGATVISSQRDSSSFDIYKLVYYFLKIKASQLHIVM